MVTNVTGVNERMNEKEPVLRETIHYAEEINDEGIYRKLKYRKIEQIGFYIRPARVWFFPCVEDQKKLRKLLAEAHWILGNKDYEPQIELNNTHDEIDDNSWETLEEHNATKEEIDRIGIGGWEKIPTWKVEKK